MVVYIVSPEIQRIQVFRGLEALTKLAERSQTSSQGKQQNPTVITMPYLL